MRHLTAVISDELNDLRSFHDRLKFSFHYLLLLERTFGWACSFLFALHLDCSLNTRVDKKIKCSFYICEIVFHSRPWLKLSIFLSLVLFSLQIHNRSGKKLTEKKLNVDRQFFKDVQCATLLQEGVGQCQFLGKIATHFPQLHLFTTPLKWRFLYILPTAFYYNPRRCQPTVLLINNIYSQKSKLKHTSVDIKCFFVNKIFVNET